MYFKRGTNILNYPLLAVLLTLVLYFVLIGWQISKCNNNFSCFITAGSKFINAQVAPANLIIQPNSWGYDGQFYYRLALNPLTNKLVEYGIKLDNPPYRHQRIILPMLAWLFSTGFFQLIPFLLVFINFLALGGIALYGGLLAKMFNRHALWGMAFSLYPGFIFTLRHDLTEILEIFFIISCFYYIRKEKWIVATLLLVLALLTKETAVLVAVAIFFTNLLPIKSVLKKWNIKHIPWPVSLVPLAVCGIWQIVLYLIWGNSSYYGAVRIVSWPFIGLLSSLHFSDPITKLFYWQSTIYLILFSFIVIWSFKKTSSKTMEILSWVLFFLLLSAVPGAWLEQSFLRLAAEFFIIGQICLLTSSTKLKYIILAMTIFLWLSAFNLPI